MREALLFRWPRPGPINSIFANQLKCITRVKMRDFVPKVPTSGPGAHPEIFQGGFEFFKKQPAHNCTSFSCSQTGFRSNSYIVTTFAYSKTL